MSLQINLNLFLVIYHMHNMLISPSVGGLDLLSTYVLTLV
jgi:hypothetical protein